MSESGKQFHKQDCTARTRHSVLRQLATLNTMTLEQLREKWLDLYGSDPPPYKKQFLIKAPGLSHPGTLLRRPVGSRQDPLEASRSGQPRGPDGR